MSTLQSTLSGGPQSPQGFKTKPWRTKILGTEDSEASDSAFGATPREGSFRGAQSFRHNFGHLEYEITIDDPKAYTKPWKITIPFELFPDNELMEAVCENERDFECLVGK
jgi:hypothetical protein